VKNGDLTKQLADTKMLYSETTNELSEYKINADKNRMIIKQDIELALTKTEREENGPRELRMLGRELFAAGDYSYAAVFLKHSSDSDPYGQCYVLCRAMYPACLLAQNPTPEGWGEFQTNIEFMMMEIKQAISKHSTGSATAACFYNNRSSLDSIRKDLNLVAAVLPDSSEKQNYVYGLVDQIKELENETTNNKP
jgi:hypothetical protein